jgi:hypothetical protein
LKLSHQADLGEVCDGLIPELRFAFDAWELPKSARFDFLLKQFVS